MDEIDKRAEQAYREYAAERFPAFRDNLINDPFLVGIYPERQDRENYLGMEFDRLVGEEIREIRERPGTFADNLANTLYTRLAEGSVANDNRPKPEPWRGSLPTPPDSPSPDRER